VPLCKHCMCLVLGRAKSGLQQLRLAGLQLSGSALAMSLQQHCYHLGQQQRHSEYLSWVLAVLSRFSADASCVVTAGTPPL
jgi:hypothetical protein